MTPTRTPEHDRIARLQRQARAMVARENDRAYREHDRPDPETDALVARMRDGYSVNGSRIA